MKRIIRILPIVIVIIVIFSSGCFSPFKPVVRPGEVSNTSMVTEIPTPTVLDTTTPVTAATTLPTVTIVTTATPRPESGRILVDETYSLTIDEYKEYKFSDFGYDFLYEGDRFQFSITSEKPVTVYVVGYMDSIRIQASDNTPHYEEGDTRLQWGNVKPAFYWERVTDRIAAFTIKDVGSYSFVVDPRWMTYDERWATKRPFTYKLRITRL